MEKKDIPQDPSKLQNFTKEICYAVDENGKYIADLSSGWEVKSSALDVAWKDIDTRISDAKLKMQKGEVSPILYMMEVKLMDLPTISDYTGFWKWTIKRHLKPSAFKNLSEKKLKKYAEVFDISVDELRNMNKG